MNKEQKVFRIIYFFEGEQLRKWEKKDYYKIWPATNWKVYTSTETDINKLKRKLGKECEKALNRKVIIVKVEFGTWTTE